MTHINAHWLGIFGTILVILAYIPQIRHLMKMHCGEGVSLTYENWLASSNNRLFVRLAWANGGASETDRFIAAGFATERRENDLFGLAVGAGRDSSGSGDWQGVVETFYRWQIGPHFTLTPSAQVVFGNGLQPDHPFRLVAGIKGAATF